MSCWITAPSARDAHRRAVEVIEGEGYEILSHAEVGPASLASATGDDRAFIA